MDFASLFGEPQKAPVVEQGVPAGGMPPPLPQTPQVQQAPQQAPADPAKVSQWRGILDRIAEPDVFGPLQTFLATAAAPLQPGESMGARLGYAGTVARLHKTMLDENARLHPQLERERERKLQEMEANIAQSKAATESSRASTRRANTETDFQETTKSTRIKTLEQQLKNAQNLGDKTAIDLARARLDQELDREYGKRGREADVGLKEQQIKESASRERMNNRLPKADSGSSSTAATKQRLVSTAKGQVQMILNQFDQARRDPNSDEARAIAAGRNQQDVMRAWLAKQDAKTQQLYGQSWNVLRDNGEQLPGLPAVGGATASGVRLIEDVRKNLGK